MERRSLLVILALPDDESFPIGATLAAYAAQGTVITLVTATSGQQGFPGLAPAQVAACRSLARPPRRLGTSPATSISPWPAPPSSPTPWRACSPH